MRNEDDIPVGGSGKVNRSTVFPAISVIGLALAILAVITCWLPVIGIPAGVFGIILSFIGNSRLKTGLGKAGFAVAILGTVLSIIFLLVEILGFIHFAG